MLFCVSTRGTSKLSDADDRSRARLGKGKVGTSVSVTPAINSLVHHETQFVFDAVGDR